MIHSKTHWKTALVDADRIVMGAGYGSEKSIKGELVAVDPLAYALHKAKLIVERIQTDVSADEYILYIGDPTVKHFRYKIAKTQKYKENRKKSKRPEHEQNIRDYLINKYNAVVVSGVEVDDALGIEQMRKKDTIICSNDKDLDMIPGWHYDIDWGIVRQMNEQSYTMKAYKKTNIYYIEDPGFLSLRQIVKDGKKGKKKLVGGGQLWFCAQLLMGDKCDNIPGVPLKGNSCYGEVSTYDALKDCKTYKEAVQKCWTIYKDKLSTLTPEELLARFKELAQLIWIKRAPKEKIFSQEWLL